MAKQKDKEKKKSLSDQFTEALPMFLPMLAGGLIGGLDTAVAAQEGANRAVEAQAAADVAAAKQALEEKKLEEDTRLREKEIGIKQDKLNQDMALAQMSLTGPGKKKELSAAASMDLGKIQSAQAALEEMQAAMDAGENKFSIIGENPYTAAQKRFVEAFGRLQSGGAISEKEFELFKDLTPSSLDEEAIVKQKMESLRSDLAQRYENLTGEPSQLAQASKQIEGFKEIADRYSLEEIQEALNRRRGR